MVYVASSFENSWQPQLIAALKEAKIDAYDFHHQPHAWREVHQLWEKWTRQEWWKALHIQGVHDKFENDFRAIEECSHCILVLPAGRSSHLEAGLFAAHAKKRLTILIPTEFGFRPELMYLMADHIVFDIYDAVASVKDKKFPKTMNLIQEEMIEIARRRAEEEAAEEADVIMEEREDEYPEEDEEDDDEGLFGEDEEDED